MPIVSRRRPGPAGGDRWYPKPCPPRLRGYAVNRVDAPRVRTVTAAATLARLRPALVGPTWRPLPPDARPASRAPRLGTWPGVAYVPLEPLARAATSHSLSLAHTCLQSTSPSSARASWAP